MSRMRPVRTNVEFRNIFDREGILKGQKCEANLSQVHDASIYLFKQIVDRKDPRHRLAKKYAHIKRKVNFKPINFENGMRASYASRSKGGNKPYGFSITGILHVRQLVRTLVNIEVGHRLIWRKKPIAFGNRELVFERTKSLVKKRSAKGVTGCPEAMWQLQLFDKKRYVGRIGFNFHVEDGKRVVTIANVQGGIGAKELQENLKQEIGSNFGEFLISHLQKTLGPDFIYRGMFPKGDNITLYRMSFRKAKPRVNLWKESPAQFHDYRDKKKSL